MAASAASPAGAPMQSWLENWSEWEIQAVVCVSFGLQVILFFFAGIRRYNISFVLKVFLWLVYLTADAAAIYALGHMSASLSRTLTDKHQLVAFWAPFLLLHLGGQDTITAYALEDNELWLRHLLTMSVQVAGTGYVLHKYIIADRATIVFAAVLISVAGFVKYGERIWALKSASKDSNGTDLISREHDTFWVLLVDATNCFNRNKKFRTYAFTMKIAHEYRYRMMKPLIIGRDDSTSTDLGNNICSIILRHVDGLLDQGDVSTREKRCAEEVQRAIKVQLAVMYDMLYTKADVVHTWYGYLFRVIYVVCCFGALVAFTRSKRDGYCTPDIVITFILLGGACALEVASAVKVIGSTWTYFMLRCYKLQWLASAILFARYHLIFVKDGRWSNSVGQYDLISFCASDKTKLKGRMAGWIGLEDWWNKAHYTKQAEVSPALYLFVWDFLRGEKRDMVRIEDVAIRSEDWARRLTGFNQCEELDWSLRLKFHNCVFIWHMATRTFLSDPVIRSELVDNGMAEAEAVSTLSNYMMYLLVQHPDIMSTKTATCSLFHETHNSFHEKWKKYIKNGIVDVPHQIMERYKDGGQLPETYDLRIDDWDMPPGEVVLVKACILVRTLLSMNLELTHKMIIIGRAWIEMLEYAATSTSGDFHARQLSNGGEFLTHMLLLSKYSSTRYQRRVDRRPMEVSVPVEPTKEVGGHVKLNVDTDSEEEITEVR